MFFTTRFTRALVAVSLQLSAQVALAGYNFEDGNLKGEVNLTASAATITTRNVNFGSGRVDQRSGKNGGSRIGWQEVYVKPAIKFDYALTPDISVLGGASVVAASTFGDGDAGPRVPLRELFR